MAYSRARRLAQLLSSDGKVGASKIPESAVDSPQLVDGSIDTAHLSDNAITLAKMAGVARGKIIIGDSSGNPVALAVGTSGQALVSDGTDTAWGAGGKSTGEIQDIVGGMVTGNDETDDAPTVTYDSSAKKLDLVGKTVESVLRVVGRGTLPSAYVNVPVSDTKISVAARSGTILVGGVQVPVRFNAGVVSRA